MKTIIKNGMELIVSNTVFEMDYKPDGWVEKTQPLVKPIVTKDDKKEVKHETAVKKTATKVSKPKTNKK